MDADEVFWFLDRVDGQDMFQIPVGPQSAVFESIRAVVGKEEKWFVFLKRKI